MPRPLRIEEPGYTHHVVQRGHNRNAVFFHDDDYRLYLHHLRASSERCECDVHAYVLMTNHVHLLVTPRVNRGMSRMMQLLNLNYGQWVNKTYQRSGTLWEGRFKSCLIDTEAYLLTCYRYIEMNPVRAGMVESPEEYPWSSYRHHDGLKTDPLITDHPVFLELGADRDARSETYRALIAQQLEPQSLETIRETTFAGTVLGSNRFRDDIADRLGCRVRPGKPGRRWPPILSGSDPDKR